MIAISADYRKRRSAATKRWQAANPERTRKIFQVGSYKRTDANKLAVINVLTHGEGTCRRCGHGDLDVLCLDHVYNNGNIHRETTNRLGGRAYAYLIKTGYAEADMYQVLCANCNLKKEVERRHARRVVYDY